MSNIEKLQKQLTDIVSEYSVKFGELQGQIEKLKNSEKQESFKKGDYVICKERGVLGLTIDNIYLINKEVLGELIDIIDDFGDGKGYFSSRFRKATVAEVDKHLKDIENNKIKENQVFITVDGGEYFSEYKKGYVQFGCAKIDNLIIRNCFLIFTKTNNSMISGNRAIESIQIGKGSFTFAMIEKMYKNLID